MQRYKQMLPSMTPGCIIEVAGSATDPPICSWFRAQVLLVDQKISETKKTELVYVAEVKLLSPVLQELIGHHGTFSLELCRPLQPSENVNLIPGEKVEVLVDDIWINGVIVTVSVNRVFTARDAFGHLHEIRRRGIRRKKFWISSNGKWILV